jgi:TPR repeat protein
MEARKSFRAGDFARAFAKLERLEQWGNRSASLYIADMCERGYPGVPRDVPKAVQRYEALAQEQNASAMAALAALYFKGTNVPQNYARAFELYSALAAAGDARSQFMLGDMYLRGRGVERDEGVALKWFESASVGGNVHALRNVGAMRLLSGRWGGLLLFAKGIGLTWYLRLFDKKNSRLRRQ